MICSIRLVSFKKSSYQIEINYETLIAKKTKTDNLVILLFLKLVKVVVPQDVSDV